MLINEISDSYHLHIENYDNNAITVNGVIYNNPICITDKAVVSVNKSNVSELNIDDFAEAINNHAELILIGTGQKHLFIHPKLIAQLSNKGIGLESMTTQAACRTYMILRSEERQVWAWLWPN